MPFTNFNFFNLNMDTTSKLPALTYEELEQFTGGIDRFRSWSQPNVIHTAGVQHVAEFGNAFWLTEQIGGYLNTTDFKCASLDQPRIAHMNFWTLEVIRSRRAFLTASADGRAKPFFSYSFKHTDFPLPSLDIWAVFNGVFWTLTLPTEY